MTLAPAPSAQTPSSAAPEISLVVPMHGVEAYLPRFLASLDAQDVPPGTIEVILIDDGSPDASGDIAQHWLAQQERFLGTLVRQENTGVSTARQRGLARAQGAWISFPDPDDELATGHLSRIRAFLAAHGREVDAVTPAILRIDEARGRIRDTHALRKRFARGTRIVDVEREPDTILMSVATGFFPTRVLRDKQIAFVPDLHASEDALFVADYYISLGHSPRLGVVADAHYLYRRRLAGTSAVDGYSERAESYLGRFRDHYLPRLRAFGAEGAPRWLQHMLVYEYRWIFQPQVTGAGYATVLDETQRADALAIARDILAHIDDDVLRSFAATKLSVESRALMLALKGSAPPAGPYVFPERGGRHRSVSYRRAEPGSAPTGLAADSRDYFPDYFGQRVLLKTVRIVRSGSPRGVRVARFASLRNWEPERRYEGSLRHRIGESIRRARSGWLSSTELRKRRALASARLRGRTLDVVLTPAAAAAHGPYLHELRAHGLAAREAATNVRTLASTRVIVCTVDDAEAVRAAQDAARLDGARRVVLIDRHLSPRELVSLDAADADLLIATTRESHAWLISPERRHGYVLSTVVHAAPSEAADAVRRLARGFQRPRREAGE